MRARRAAPTRSTFPTSRRSRPARCQTPSSSRWPAQATSPSAAAAAPAAPPRRTLGGSPTAGAPPGSRYGSNTPMLKRPRLKAGLTRATVDGDKLFLISEYKHFLLEGRTAAAVAPLLNGEQTTG